MKLTQPLLHGRLVRRYKRFLADVELDDGGMVTVHCPNSGSMKGLTPEGAPVLVSDSGNPKRKLRMTLERVRVGRTWVGVNTMLPNHIVREGIEEGRVPALRGYRTVRSEVKLGDSSRIDLFLTDGDGPDCWVEVKNATLRVGRRAAFPDAVTSRGLKHLDELIGVVEAGQRAAMFFLVNRADCDGLEPADDIDPAYGAGLRRAARAGVEVLAHRALLTPDAARVGPALPVHL